MRTLRVLILFKWQNIDSPVIDSAYRTDLSALSTTESVVRFFIIHSHSQQMATLGRSWVCFSSYVSASS